MGKKGVDKDSDKGRGEFLHSGFHSPSVGFNIPESPKEADHLKILDNLNVYAKALAFCANAESLSRSWGRKYAIVGQFRRAAESIVLNIALGAGPGSPQEKAKHLDYAVGSTLECAACLDIARVKGRHDFEGVMSEKGGLSEIIRMLIGLRKAWQKCLLQEDGNAYMSESLSMFEPILFHHERLDVYQIALQFIGWFIGVPGGKELSSRLCREIDKSSTCMVLNIAEGNGRYSELDHRRFHRIAASATVKTAAFLDLYREKALPQQLETAPGRELLARVLAMLSKF